MLIILSLSLSLIAPVEPSTSPVESSTSQVETSTLTIAVPAVEAPDLPVPDDPKDDPKGEKAKKSVDKEPTKAPEYPKLNALHNEQVKRLFRNFKNRNPAKRKEHVAQMIQIGRGAVPDLLKYADTKHEAQGECIYECLMTLLDERDLFVLKDTCFKADSDRMRRLAVVRIARMEREDQAAFLKFGVKDRVEDIRLEAALGLLYLKDATGIGEIILAVAKNRKDPPKRLVEPLPKVKGKAYGSLFLPYLVKHKNPEVRIAACRVITWIEDKGLKGTLGRALNDPHNLVKTAAVNGLRKLVRGEDPREFKNVFQLVEAVNTWKKDLGLIR